MLSDRILVASDRGRSFSHHSEPIVEMDALGGDGDLGGGLGFFRKKSIMRIVFVFV